MESNALYYGDCLDWMEEWPDESVDLIYLDPPFNSNAQYNILFGKGNGTPAQVRGFTDTWKWDEAAVERMTRFENAIEHPLHDAVAGFKILLGQSGMLAYLTYMAERLFEARRLLKPTGSIYLHCDDTASHYLKILMDGIFGPQHYRNAITWRRATAHNDAKRFGRIADHILFYVKTDSAYWDETEGGASKTEEELRKAYPLTDELGRYRSADLSGPSHGADRGSPSTLPWREYDVYELGRVWAVPKTGAYAEYIERNFIPGYRSIEGIHERLDALDEAGLIHHPKTGRWPGLKRYADADLGKPPQDLILEPTGFTNYNARRGGEYLGYPTQKRVGLIEKLIPVACPPDGIVLDPFCGCGTTVVAAHNLGRRWIGIDISATAIDIIQEYRFKPLGIESETYGIPRDLASARKLAAERPFDFEAWAVTRIPGMAPNERKRGDHGIDGRGSMLEKPEDASSKLVLAQVKGGRSFQLGSLRDFLHVVERENAALGVYITVDSVKSGEARAEARAKGTVSVGASVFPRVQLWSISDFFEGRWPNLPTLTNPYTGKPIQSTLI